MTNDQKPTPPNLPEPVTGPFREGPREDDGDAGRAEHHRTGERQAEENQQNESPS
jgi:hypothetical protein